jgi:hypothetical protein
MKGVESFLGFANFYQQFIKNFSIIAAPLNQLKGKDKEWNWGEEQQKAFDKIKTAIISKLVLVLPRDEGKFKVETDASNFGIGAILSQQQNGFWHPIAFMSKTLTKAERNYEIYDKELLTIIKALRTWRQYLLNAKKQFEICTDHKNLKYFQEPQKLNAQQARWYLMLQEYNFLLRHIPGKDNTKADILSRLIKPDTSNDNTEVEMFKDRILIRKIQGETMVYEGTLIDNQRIKITADTTLLEDIRGCKRRESRVVQEMEKQPKKLWENDGVIYRSRKIYVPNSQEICDHILHNHHYLPDVGHPGIHQMLELVKRTFWWPTIKTDVK